MPNYGVRYQCNFDPLKDSTTDNFFIQILQKDYIGGITSVLGGSVPLLHSWQTDDPKAPVKGSSVTVTLINRGDIPLETFFSVDDDEFKIRVYFKTDIIFEGFLVQDDCNEIIVDTAHEIQLSATDNLGLIKGVALDKSPTNFSPVYSANTTYSSTAPHTLIFDPVLAAQMLPGDRLNIVNLIFNVNYTVVDIFGTPNIIVAETVGTSGSPITAQVTILRSTLLEKITLATVIKTCLLATGLQLHTFIWTRIAEVSQDNSRSFLEQTLIDPQTFINGQQQVIQPIGNLTELNYQQLYDDCYTVLTKVLGSLNMTLFQSKGAWHIVRWEEFRYFDTISVSGFEYDADFNYVGLALLNQKFNIDPNLPPAARPEITPTNGLLHRINRPLLYDLETFNYKQPALLLRNYDLQTLGALLRTYPVTIWITKDGVIHYTDPGLGGGSGTIITFQTWNEYAAPWWYYEDAFPSESGVNGPAVYFIRIVFDNIGQEVDRYIVTKNNHIHSYKVEANQYDIFTYSFNFKTPDKDWSGAIFQIIIKLTNGTTTLYPKAIGEVGQTLPGWGPGDGFAVNIGSDTKNSFCSVSLTVQPIPFDGLLTFYLQTQSLHAADETQYKDIRLQYIPLISQSSRITGQTHRTFQPATIKQFGNEEIFIDSSPRNSIAGTLFLNTMIGLLQKRTSQWNHPYIGGSFRLGQLITFENLFWRRKSRSILEGTFLGIENAGILISMLSVFKCSLFPTFNMVMGKCDIDYKNNKFTATLWLIWEDGEVDADLNSDYNFEYLYAPI